MYMDPFPAIESTFAPASRCQSKLIESKNEVKFEPKRVSNSTESGATKTDCDDCKLVSPKVTTGAGRMF